MPDDAEKSAFDVVVLHGATDDGKGMKVLRVAGSAAADGKGEANRLEAGEVRPLKEGQPLMGEVVKLTPREGSPSVCDVDVAMKVEAPIAAKKAGPAQVATDAYRSSWERIFGGNSEGRALN